MESGWPTNPLNWDAVRASDPTARRLVRRVSLGGANRRVTDRPSHGVGSPAIDSEGLGDEAVVGKLQFLVEGAVVVDIEIGPSPPHGDDLLEFP